MSPTTLQNLTAHITPKKAAIAIVLIYFANRIRTNYLKSTFASKLHKLALQKRQQRDAQISTEFVSPNDIPEGIRTLILNSTVTELSELLNQDKITSEQILNVYHSRAITLGLNLQLIGDSNYKEALELAIKCDEIRRNTKPEDRHTLGGLFGIPISIKDSFVQKGLDSTCGGARSLFQPNDKDGEIIALLKSRGAIPFIRSNVPQTLVVLDCANHIWGRGQNPWNKDRTLGGSSAGEAGLIAARCSPIGLGSDALGSIRIPSAFTGVYGFKPTRGRYITLGHSKLGVYSASKFSSTYPANGPIGRCVDDLVLFTRELVREEIREVDPLYPYVAWNQDKYLDRNKLKIGYVITEDFFGASKTSQRAVRETVEALKGLGHELVEVKFPSFERMILLMIMITASEGKGKGTLQALGGEEPIKEIKGQMAFKALPLFLKRFVKFLLKMKGFNRMADIVEAAEEITVEQYHDKMNEYYTLRDEFIQFFRTQKLDAIISPAMPVPALKHGYGADLGLASCYNWPANIVNLPAGVVPVTFVKEGEDAYTRDECRQTDLIFKHLQENIKGSVGLPMAVQVMTLPWEDEKCLAVMKMIESEIKFKTLPNV